MLEAHDNPSIDNESDDQHPDILYHLHVSDDKKIYFKSKNGVVLIVEWITHKIVKIRYSHQWDSLDFSYGVVAPSLLRNENITYQFLDKGDHHLVLGQQITVRIWHDGLKVDFIENKTETLLSSDHQGYHWNANQPYGDYLVKMSKKSFAEENFYGLGDKSCNLNLKNKKLELWSSDTYGYGRDTDPLYKNIPFFITLSPTYQFGIFFDNSFKSSFHFSQKEKETTTFEAVGGEMNYYFIYGDNILDVSSQYTLLTGTPELPPKWTLGYHQCKWSYYPENTFRNLANTFRKLQIPCDAIYLDIDYMDGYRCFTWDLEKFPDPKKMICDLKDFGFKTIAIIDPGIKVDPDYHVWNEGIKNDYFCHRGNGPLMQAPVWPGECNFPDFTNPQVRAWWSGLFQDLIADKGISGIWNDMNEPAIFLEDNFKQTDRTFPDDVRHDYDGHPCGHTKAHNVYGMQMARATYEGVKNFGFPNRPFVITRAGYAGTQRYSSAWTGDNISNWEHLWIANIQCQRLSLSGWSFVGSDIGGFTESPSGELYTRWLQMGVFHVFCRTHSAGDTGDQEPWSFGEPYTSIARKFINLRYQLLPYLYTTFWEHTLSGVPIIRSLVTHDSSDFETHNRMEEFSIGENILVCPIIQAGGEGRWMYLPKGEWFYYWTDELTVSQKEIWVDAGIDKIPMFIKAGSVIPKYPVLQYVGEKPIAYIELNVYFINGIKDNNQLYEDEGNGYNYSDGIFRHSIFVVKGSENTLTVEQQILQDLYLPDYKKYRVKLHGVNATISVATVDDIQLDVRIQSFIATDIYVLEVPLDFKVIQYHW